GAGDRIGRYGNDSLRALGKAAALKLVEKSGTQSWKPAVARMSKSGDLGYTSGSARVAGATAPAPTGPTTDSGARPPAPATPHYYVRIWRRDKAGVWKIVLDVTT